jgi:uncharacterized protein involved in exopolysaccharide biosynthesis
MTPLGWWLVFGIFVQCVIAGLLAYFTLPHMADLALCLLIGIPGGIAAGAGWLFIRHRMRSAYRWIWPDGSMIH